MCLDRPDYEALIGKFDPEIKDAIENIELISSYVSPVPGRRILISKLNELEFPHDVGSNPADKFKKMLRSTVQTGSSVNLLGGIDLTKSMPRVPPKKSEKSEIKESQEGKKDLLWLYK